MRGMNEIFLGSSPKERMKSTGVVRGSFFEGGRWDPYAAQYKLLWGHLHSRTAAIALVAWEVFWILSSVGAFISTAANLEESEGVGTGTEPGIKSSTKATILSTLGMDIAIKIAFIGLFAYGLWKEQANFLLPHIIFRSIRLILNAIAFLLLIIFLFCRLVSLLPSSISDEFHGLSTGVIVVMIVALNIFLLIQVCLLIVCVRVFRYLRDKRRFQSFRLDYTLGAPPPPFPPATIPAHPPGYAYGSKPPQPPQPPPPPYLDFPV